MIIRNVSFSWDRVDAQVETVANAIWYIREFFEKTEKTKLMLLCFSDEGGDDDEEVRGQWGRTRHCALCHHRVSRRVLGCTG
jgi:hypothetical protein